MKWAARVLSPLFLSFVIYHWGDEFQISITGLLNIDGSSKSLTRSRQGRRGGGGQRGIGPSVCSLAPASPRLSHLVGSSQVRGSLFPTIISPQLLCDLLMSRQGPSPEHLLLSYISIRKKKKSQKLSNYAICRAAFIHCSRCVNYNESTAVWLDTIAEIFNWVSADLVCVRTHRRWRD